jgi:sulfur dioxygenase
MEASMIEIRQLFDPETSTYTYLLWDPSTREAALVDPVREHVERDLKLVSELELQLSFVLETHVHADHVTSAGLLADRTGATTVASALGAPCAVRHLADGESIHLGANSIRAIATPGHTRDSLSYYVDGNLFTGDALLIRGTGRTDFQSGDAGQLYDAITKKLFSYPDTTKVWPGHDYRGQSSSTVGEEKRCNPRLAGKTRDEFIEIMNGLALAPPKKIQQAVPANLVCGRETQSLTA